MTAPDADPSATLAGIKERYRRCGNSPDIHANLETWIGSANDVPSLVAALDAVLALAGKWDRVDARLGEIGRDSAPVGDLRREMAFSHAKIFEDCAATLREAITSALTGEPANPSAPAAGTGEDEGL